MSSATRPSPSCSRSATWSWSAGCCTTAGRSPAWRSRSTGWYQPAGLGTVAQQHKDLLAELAANGLLARQRSLQLPLAPRRIGIVAGGAGTVGYHDAVAVWEQSGFQVLATPFPAPLEGEQAPARIAAQIQRAAAGNQAILVVRGGGEDAQLSAFNSAAVASAIATAPVPVITGIGHSHHRTLADAVAYRDCASPAHAAGFIAARLQGAQRALERELDGIRRAAEARRGADRAARRRRVRVRAGGAVVLVGLAGLAGWRLGGPAAGLLILLALALAALVRRRRPLAPALAPSPTAASFEAVVRELGAVKAALQQAATSDDDVRRLLEAAAWLERRGGELLGRQGPPGR